MLLGITNNFFDIIGIVDILVFSNLTQLVVSLQSFVLKHILHVIVFKTIYNFMSSFTIDMTGIPPRSLYYDLLSGNFKNSRNKLFFSFDFACFNIVICPMTICTLHSYFSL